MRLSEIAEPNHFRQTTITLYGGPTDGRTLDIQETTELPNTITITCPCGNGRAHKNHYTLIVWERNGLIIHAYRHTKVTGLAWLTGDR